MCGYFSVDVTQCSPHIEINGDTCHSDFLITEEAYEFVYLGVPPIDESGCYSFSFRNNTGFHTMAGFGVNDALSRSLNDAAIWNSVAYHRASPDFLGLEGRGDLASDNDLEMHTHRRSTDTLTLIYNPTAGTLHGAFYLEPAILLRNNIPPGDRAPLQPFVAFLESDETITIVERPRALM